MLLGMCFYFLNVILPWHTLQFLIALFLFCAGIFYLRGAQKTTGSARTIKTIVAVMLMGSSVFFAVKGVQALFLNKI